MSHSSSYDLGDVPTPKTEPLDDDDHAISPRKRLLLQDVMRNVESVAPQFESSPSPPTAVRDEIKEEGGPEILPEWFWEIGIADTSVGIITINEDDDIPNRATVIPDASAFRPKPNSVKSEF